LTRRAVWQLVGLMTLALLACGAPAIASSGDELLAGCEALYLGDWQRAHDCFSRAEAIDATCPEAMVGIGISLLQTGESSRAANALENALIVAPEMAAVHAGLAAVRYVEGDNYQAMLGYRRALGYARSRRTRVRASEAYLACRLGLYQSAMGEAETAMRDDPGDELARHALGSSLLALGLRERAAVVLSQRHRGFRPPAPGLLSAPSALMALDARYRAEHQLGDEQRLASILPSPPSATGPAADAGTAGGLPQADVDPHFFISYPPPGSVVSDTIEVAIEDDGTYPVRHIAALLDNRFLVMSNAQPFRAQVNTTRVKDGLRELRVEGYATSGEIVARATIMLQVSNGSRTLAPSEQAARELARGELLNLATLRAEPLVNAQLLGHALMGSDRKWEAIATWEYVFANDPLLPGARADLLTGYRELGLRTTASPREIHFLRGPRTVALTFDDGPHPEMTPFILDLLDRYHMKATFFLVGKQAAMYPELVREIARRGHDLGSHSHTHCDLRRLDQRGVEQELVKSRAAIRQACGQTVTLFRPPGGNYDDEVRAAVGSCGYTTVFWTENIGNYPGREGPDIAHAMIGKLARGGIVLLHNGYDETEVALPHLLPLIASKGLRTGTITELSGGG
jgi:peptidoglycan/xylan/chitin deacetylase (PgdA/CDA1 family)/Flp pilus assembly protein TadD